jgi:hypothetical protein
VRPAILLLASLATADAQTVLDERRLGIARAKFEDPAPPDTLHCSVTPIHPTLNYSFRFQAGYFVTIPMNQFEGPGHRWSMITRVTPEGGRPVYLASNYALPNVPKTKIQLQVGGGYLLGEGAYSIRHVFYDDADRTCRKDWRVEVRRGRGESKVKVAMPPDTVWDISLRGSRMLPAASTDDAAPLRLTILLHAAPSFPRRTRLRQGDIMMLLASVTSLLEHVPATSVRLVAFNLDQQKELYRKDRFLLRDMPAVADAMSRTELGLVDISVLQNKRGHVETIADLVNREVKSEPPSDVVLFLGPTSRFGDKVPHEVLEKPEPRGPHWMFFQLMPVFRGGRGGATVAAPVLPDSIKNAVSRLGGKTFTIRSPGDLAKAIDRLETTRPNSKDK